VGGGRYVEPVVSQTRTQWANSIQAYIKNWDLYRGPSQNVTTLTGETFTPGIRPAEVGMAMNGLLHAYSATAVASPSLVPLIWSGVGNTALRGRSGANPSLSCGGVEDCRFNPSGPAQADNGNPTGNQSLFFGYANFNPGYKVWTHGTDVNGGGVVWVRADTSAKFARAGTVLTPAFHTSAETDPYALVTPTGGFSYWASTNDDCSNIQQAAGVPRYVCFFRPDRVR
jgi:hypothetical protein